jgi:hypothetical protein
VLAGLLDRIDLDPHTVAGLERRGRPSALSRQVGRAASLEPPHPGLLGLVDLAVDEQENVRVGPLQLDHGAGERLHPRPVVHHHGMMRRGDRRHRRSACDHEGGQAFDARFHSSSPSFVRLFRPSGGGAQAAADVGPAHWLRGTNDVKNMISHA